ncbi:MAG: acetate/propionate family kinase [Patescibacteria group bacterium]|nr:acetate/propionate family kinase [Patescibacteria group bacterium]MDE1945995.1 acetate/propionate family kinase [Patescibacteria group bacterium]
MKKYLIVNTGSVSAKYSIYSELAELFYAYFETDGGKPAVDFYDSGRKGNMRTEKITGKDFDDSLECFLDEAEKKGIIANRDEISSVGVRVVAPGTYFQEDRIIDSFFMDHIVKEKDEAPLHVKRTLAEIAELRNILPKTPIVGISDSAFHKNAPDFARLYAIPKDVSDKFEIYHYGYHGISVGSIVEKLAKSGARFANVVICHLGGGSSITAVKNGKSFDTSMGYTPLEGLITSTRAGNIDPVAVFHLARKLKKNAAETEEYLNTECGLLGLSKKSGDMRDVIEAAKAGDAAAKLAFQKFVMAAKKYVGGFAAEMGGIDALVFSGAIGERAAAVRAEICDGLKYMGVTVDRPANDAAIAVAADIAAADARVKVLVIPTDEMESMAERLRAFRVLKHVPMEKKKPGK